MQGEQSNTQDNSDRNQQSLTELIPEITFDEIISKIDRLMKDLK